MPSAVTQIVGPAASGATTPPNAAAQAQQGTLAHSVSQVIKANERDAKRKSAETRKVAPNSNEKKVIESPNLDPQRRTAGKNRSEEEKDQGEDTMPNTGHLDVVA